MSPQYDVFRVKADGQLLWLSSAYSLDEAKGKINLADGDGDFVILNQQTQEQITVKAETERHVN